MRGAIGGCAEWVVSWAGLTAHEIRAGIATSSPDVVFLVPETQTAEVLSLVRTLVLEVSFPPILAIAVANDSRLALRSIEAGASGYVLAENIFDELPAAVKTVLAKRIYLSPGVAGVRRAALSSTDSASGTCTRPPPPGPNGSCAAGGANGNDATP